MLALLVPAPTSAAGLDEREAQVEARQLAGDRRADDARRRRSRRRTRAQSAAARSTNSRHSACERSRQASSRCGSVRSPAGIRSAISGVEPQMPGADGGQRRRAGGGRVDGAALHRHAGGVGLELEQGRVAGQAAVDAQHLDRHRLADRRDARRRPARRSPRARRARRGPGRVPEVSPAITARASGLPPRRADPGERRQHADAAGVLDLGRRGGERGRVGRQPEVAAQPLEQRAGGEDAAVDRPLDPPVDAPGDGGQQAAAGLRALGRRRGRARTRRSRRSP